MKKEQRKQLITEQYRELYGSEPELWVRAPGRVDLMGSHTDYNLGFIMTMPISRDTWIAAGNTENSGPRMRMYSNNLKESVEADLQNIIKNQDHPWINYPLGVAHVLREEGYDVSGFDGVVDSTIPIGSGLSSSAAFEAASINLFQSLGGYNIDLLDQAKYCQRAENNFVGMNCGILDQYSSILGEADKTVLLDCKYLRHEAVPFPQGLAAVICNTNAPRELTGSEYGDRRRQCEEGTEIIKRKYPEVSSLRDATLQQLEACSGEMSETVARRSKFVIEENKRVLDLADAVKENDYVAISRLFAESFAGARDLFEISVPAMEQMVEAMNASPGIIGARQTGAGFGGCMIGLVEIDKTSIFSSSVLDTYNRLSGLNGEAYVVTSEAGAGLLD